MLIEGAELKKELDSSIKRFEKIGSDEVVEGLRLARFFVTCLEVTEMNNIANKLMRRG